MKTWKRLFALILACLMCTTLFACSEPSDGPNSDGSDGSTSVSSNFASGTDSSDGEHGTSSIEEVVFDPGKRPYEETKGKKFVIIQHQPPETPFKYAEDSLMGEKVAERISEIESAYGIELEFVQVPANNTFGSKMMEMEITGAGGDLVFVHSNAYLRNALGTGGETSMMVDLLSVDHIINFWDMEKWGDISARETAMAGGIFYGVTPALWVDYTPFPYYLLVYNRDMLKQFHAIDPQEAWEKNAWDRDVMLESITSVYDKSTGTTVFGLAAASTHMTRATVLTTGCQLVNVDKINADGSVDWHNGLGTADVVEALQWLKNAYTDNSKYFNDGVWSASGVWNHRTTLLNGGAAYCMTRPALLFNYIVVEATFDFGLALWAGAEANVMSGFHEAVASVSIPVFADNLEHSAFIMWDLFEGLNGIESMEDMISYYRETYFTSDLDVTYLCREGAELSYSYYPHGLDDVWNTFASNLLTAATVQGMVDKFAGSVDSLIETHVLPNQVALDCFRQQGYFD